MSQVRQIVFSYTYLYIFLSLKTRPVVTFSSRGSHIFVGVEFVGTNSSITLTIFFITMPRTKSGKKDYNPTVMQQYRSSCKTDVDRSIFFNYYLGHKSGGAQGYDVISYPDGSAHHRKEGIGQVLTVGQFYRKGKKLGNLATLFLATAKHEPEEIIPPMEEMRIWTAEEIKEMIEDKRTPMEKFEDAMRGKDWMDYFIFFMYYDGIKAHRAPYGTADDVVGFNPNSGPYGSGNHKNAFKRLDPMPLHTFRTKGIKLAALAEEFLDNGVEAPEEYRPVEDEPELLHDMIEEATKLFTGLDI